MIPRQLVVLAIGVFTLNVFATVDAIPPYPHRFDTVLASTPCSGHMERLLTSTHTTVEASGVDDVCLDSLRELLATSSSVPCLTGVDPTTVRDPSSMRRLGDEYGPFKGKLNCTFDTTAAAVNLSSPSQSFIVDCQEIKEKGPYNYAWIWWTLGLTIGPLVLGCLVYLVVIGIAIAIDELRIWRAKRAQRALDRIDEAPPKGFFSKLTSQA